MKQTCTAAIMAALLLVTGQAQNVDLLSLGSTTYTISAGSSFTPTQSASDIVQNLTVASGNNFYNEPAFTPISSFDWSGFSNYGIKMTLLGGSPIALGFSVSFYDDTFALIDTYDGSTAPLLTLGAPVNVDFGGISAPGSGNYSNVQYMQFTWGGDGAVNVSASTVYGVPEPSTYALLALGGLALGGYAMRRRQRA
jgi:hypothetical protein